MLTRLKQRRLLVHWRTTTKNILTAAIICQNPIAAKNLRFVDTRIFDFSFPFILSFFRTEHVLVFRNMLLFLCRSAGVTMAHIFMNHYFDCPAFLRSGRRMRTRRIRFFAKKKRAFHVNMNKTKKNEKNEKNFSRSHIFTWSEKRRGKSAFPPNGFKMCSSLC